MCANNLYNDGMMNAFVDSFPVSFVEPYFVCRKTVLSSLKDAVGNAAGTAGMVAAVAMAIFGMIFRKVCYNDILSPHDFCHFCPRLPLPLILPQIRCTITVQSKHTNGISKAKMMANLLSWTRF